MNPHNKNKPAIMPYSGIIFMTHDICPWEAVGFRMILLRQWEIGPQSDLFRSVSTMRLKKKRKTVLASTRLVTNP